MSKLEVDKVTPQSGTTLTIGEAGDTTVINGLGTLPATIGTASQILQVNSGATGIEFGTPVDGNNLNATNLTSGTIPDGRFPSILPAAGGQNLTSLQPAAIVGGTFGAINAQNLTNIPGEISWQSTIITTNSTIVASRGYWINTTSGAVTITLPASASVGDRIILTDYLRTWGTNALTINPNSLKFQGNTSPNPVYGTNGQSVDLVYSGATQGWIPNSDDDVTFETPQTYNIDALVVAGGGGGGNGGGGAGGYRTTTFSGLSQGSSLTITVGTGGAAGGFYSVGGSGTNSSITGSPITDITSAGGGGGGSFGSSNAVAGGSGGGGPGADSGGSLNNGAAGNTPSTTPSQGSNGGGGNGTSSNGGGAGGGGANATGGNGAVNTGGVGGAGTANSITGSSVTYAGGGGGGAVNGTSGAGGAGGGGAGATGSAATAGTANTGGGGGAGGYGGSQTGAIGGTGVVILSMPDEKYSGTTTGSPTVATGVSGKTILTFTGSGSYTT